MNILIFRLTVTILLMLAWAFPSSGVAQSHQKRNPEQELRQSGASIPQSIFGKHGYIEYLRGTLPVIISVPHGGYLTPQEIPDRTLGTSGRQDVKTQELAKELVDLFHKRTGKIPYLIINRLHRFKLDANREFFDATQENPIAETAWEEFHNWIDSALQQVVQEFGTGLYIDLHGHRHTRQLIELGYLLVNNQLMLNDSTLNRAVPFSSTSLYGTVLEKKGSLAEWIRGEKSFGALLETHGYSTVPSPVHPNPDGEPYFSGGYNLEHHSAYSGKAVTGIQVELPTGLREDDNRREYFAKIFVDSVLSYLQYIGRE